MEANMNRLFYLLYAVLFLLLIVPMFGINHMDLIQTMAGEFIGSEFGASLVSMDFNGDGYDDLIVKAPLWNPDGVSNIYNMWGKIYFYWGGPGFDNIPDFVIEGQYHYHLGAETYSNRENTMINAGDMNGDGIEDLVIPQRLADGTKTVDVYFGRTNPQTTPDVELLYPALDTWQVDVFPLGDINGDEKSDISITTVPMNSLTQLNVLIWTDITAYPYPFSHVYGNLYGVGDVNADGYSDMVQYSIATQIRKFTFFYGDATGSMADSLQLGSSTEVTTLNSSPLGDVNGDGHSDFFTWNDKVWLGSNSITVQPDLLINYSPWLSFEFGAKPPMVVGDVNGDGFDDIIGADCSLNGMSGQGGVWLGKHNMNGIRDLVINPPENYRFRNFGWSKAAGDFNADGYCDVALSAPIWTQGHTWNTEGKVFVHAGNPEITDTTVANEDELTPSIDVTDWGIEVYPNPNTKVNKGQSIKFVGDAYRKQHDSIALDIYNVKGQIIMHKAVSAGELQNGRVDINLSGYPAGVYILKISDPEQPRTTRRISIY